MTLQVGVKAIIKNHEAKYLLIHRSPIRYPDADGRWDIVGGRINPGETLLENLKREIKEEINLDLVGEPKLLAAQDILRLSGLHVVRLTYLAEARGEVVLDTSENDKYQWCTLETIRNMDGVDAYFKGLVDKGVLV